MGAIFLSASVPVVGSGDYYDSADPFLIQSAVRELITIALGRRLIVWGGHPAITPMVWAVCEDLGVSYVKAVVLYQSRFFSDSFPEENRRFGNVVYVDAVAGNREASLCRMREAMLSRNDLTTAVFIGGMKGVLVEHAIFSRLHPGAKTLAIPSPGGAARQLAKCLGVVRRADLENVDFARLFHTALGISPDEPRSSPA